MTANKEFEPARIDDTHDPNRRSFVASANGHPEFPIQNLPFCVFSPPGQPPRVGVGIGDRILDMGAAHRSDVFSGEAARASEAASGTALNTLFALGPVPRRALRARLSELLIAGSSNQAALELLLHEAGRCTLHIPANIGDYTDFYVGIHHATNIGKQFRPDNPLLPNYKHVPIGYHGRASSISPSGTAVKRPNGQRKAADSDTPSFGPSQRLDYELELGIWIGPGNSLGDAIPIGHAADHVAGYCLLNDWSARDIQAWEYVPLGPFLSKNFATTISPWVVTPEALAPFRVAQAPRPEGDPTPLPYLLDDLDQREGALDLHLDVSLITRRMRDMGLPPHQLARSNARYMYWTVAQMIAHHTSGGCNLRPGDLLGTGTISGPDLSACGSMLETTLGGTQPVRLASGEERRFLEDGDEVILSVKGIRSGFASIGFGECQASILPAQSAPGF